MPMRARSSSKSPTYRQAKWGAKKRCGRCAHYHMHWLHADHDIDIGVPTCAKGIAVAPKPHWTCDFWKKC
jgi:hypothetical protein